jgi:hypothetical protein
MQAIRELREHRVQHRCACWPSKHLPAHQIAPLMQRVRIALRAVGAQRFFPAHHIALPAVLGAISLATL